MDSQKYPQSARKLATQAQAEIIGDFLQWLENSPFYVICEPTDPSDDFPYMPTSLTMNELLVQYLGIDLEQLEQELLQIIEAIEPFLFADQQAPPQEGKGE